VRGGGGHDREQSSRGGGRGRRSSDLVPLGSYGAKDRWMWRDVRAQLWKPSSRGSLHSPLIEGGEIGGPPTFEGWSSGHVE